MGSFGTSIVGYAYPYVGVLVVVLIAAILWRNSRPHRHVNLPPGPKATWKYSAPMFRSYADLIQAYGPVVSFKRGNDIQILVGSYQAAMDIMQKHGAELADRPPAVSTNELLSGNKRILFLRAGKRMLSYRKALHSSLQPSAAATYGPLQYQNAKIYVLDILRDPENHLAHARKYAASVILTLTYGKTTPTSYDDPEVIAINKFAARIMSVVKGMPWPVDKYPILRYLPLPHVRMLKQYQQDELRLFCSLMEATRRERRNAPESASPSFIGYLLDHQRDFELSDEDTAYLGGSMFGAGSDTTASGLGLVTMAAACYPQEQGKIQAAIDAVVGRDRVPRLEDLQSLPLVSAFAAEAHRWRPILPMGLNHRAMKDVVWNGYVIPAGAAISGVSWSIMRDPSIFPDPEEFRPSRWLTDDGNMRDDLKHFDFGFGRRVCPGVHVAERSLAITTALLLWAFDIVEDPSYPIDTFGLTDAPITHPLPFKVKFFPRNAHLRSLMEDRDAS
ncbi:cytochrome P450 [Cristinia sonorae]|uniref:Cytochrome P450 n=1 Tax=Cristinia sonorae TaxID=1940300 RepID=A0A8K0UUQ1_9AGAR|nr:cytochrome P450 [Cristinia sonorae]